jgi:hypothetical protein
MIEEIEHVIGWSFSDKKEVKLNFEKFVNKRYRKGILSQKYPHHQHFHNQMSFALQVPHCKTNLHCDYNSPK